VTRHHPLVDVDAQRPVQHRIGLVEIGGVCMVGRRPRARRRSSRSPLACR
jgi:hypothetical protein